MSIYQEYTETVDRRNRLSYCVDDLGSAKYESVCAFEIEIAEEIEKLLERIKARHDELDENAGKLEQSARWEKEGIDRYERLEHAASQ